MQSQFSIRMKHFRQSSWLVCCVLALLSAASVPLRASTAAIDFTGTTVNGTTGAFSLGWEFSTNVAIDVTALGFYNASLNGGDNSFQNGTCDCGEVGIFNTSGTLLTSATVTSAGPVNGFFNYASIPTLALAAGQSYFIEAETGSADYTGSTNTGFTTGFSESPDINYITDAYISSTTLAFPTGSEGITAADGGGQFGPNFEETPASAVPEPSSLQLLLWGFGSLALVGAIRGKRLV
jgi:uncharacterized protein DUF4082/PEP-CTERM motif-containing protein